MANRERQGVDTAGIIQELRHIMQRIGPLWCSPSTLVGNMRKAAVESRDWMPLIRRAHKGCSYAHRALCEQAALHICSDEKVPDDLKAYAAGALINKYPTKRSAGENGTRDIGRNLFIAHLVDLAIRRGYRLGRDGSANDPSASYLVCKAARGVKVAGLKVPDTRRVHQIWEQNRGEIEATAAAFKANKQKGPRT